MLVGKKAVAACLSLLLLTAGLMPVGAQQTTKKLEDLSAVKEKEVMEIK